MKKQEKTKKLPSYVGPFHIKYIEEDGKIHMYVEVDENSTTDKFRYEGGRLIKVRDILRKLQGSWTTSGRAGTGQALFRLHELGTSYEQIADGMRKSVAGDLKCYANGRSNIYLFSALKTLKYFHFREKDVRKNVDEAARACANDILEFLKKERPESLDESVPITGEMVEERVRQWKKKYKE